MSHLDEWAHLIAKQLKSEAELVGTQARSELYEDAARDTFVRLALDPFLPGSYAVGSGRVVDASGKISSPQDIVIFRKDYPQFNMPGRHNVFIYESVLATIQVSSKLVRKSFFKALDQCTSIGSLDPVIEPSTLKAMATKMNMQAGINKQYVHPDPLNTGRFSLIGRPQSFIYAFTGYQTSEKQLAENLSKWIDHYHEDHDSLQMKSLPSVIATQGCFAWRNTAPFAIKNRVLMGVGNDQAPLRLIIVQLMHALNRRLQSTSDGYGIKSNIAPYLAQFERPVFSETVGTAVNPGDPVPAPIYKAKSGAGASRQQVADAAQVRPAQAQAVADNPVSEKSGGMAKLKGPEIQAVDLRSTQATTVDINSSSSGQAGEMKTPAASAPRYVEEIKKEAEHSISNGNATGTRGLGNTGDFSKPDSTPEQQAQLTGSQISPIPEENESKAPVIEDLSTPWNKDANTAVSQFEQRGEQTKASPLSLYSDGSDENGEVEEYDFMPIEPPMPRAEHGDAETTMSKSEDDGFLATQEINVSEFSDKSRTTDGGLQNQNGRDETDNSFVDTVAVTSESLTQKKTEPDSSRKPEYVTESLIQ
jgi:hypothetical protein